jgi:hypothetical protein
VSPRQPAEIDRAALRRKPHVEHERRHHIEPHSAFGLLSKKVADELPPAEAAIEAEVVRLAYQQREIGAFLVP